MRRLLPAIVLTAVACSPSSGLAQWYAAVDFVPLTRAESSNAVLQRGQTPEIVKTTTTTTSTGSVTTTTTIPAAVNSQIILQAGDVSLDFVSAGRITVGTRLGGGVLGLEGSYMSTETRNSAATVLNAGGLMASPFSSVGSLPDPLLDNNLSVTVDNRSEMRSAELDLTQLVSSESTGEATLFAGVRYLSIEERLNYRSHNATTDNEFTVTVDNSFIGPQLGLTGWTPVAGGRLNMGLKTAVLYGSMDKTVIANGTPGQGHDNGAFALGEFVIDYFWFPTPNLAVRIGYQLIGVTDVGLATENLAEPIGTVRTVSVIYHGPCLGVLLSF